MSRPNMEQYSYLRQSLRHMPPTNPPLPKVDTARRSRGPLAWAQHLSHEHPDATRAPAQAIHNLSDLLHGASSRNIFKRIGKKKKRKGASGNRESGSSDKSGSSSGSGSSYSGRMNYDYSDYSLEEYSSLSEEPMDHRQQQRENGVPRRIAYHEPTTHHERDNFSRDGVITAEVSRSTRGTFDVDYANRYSTPTFDYDYTNNQLERHDFQNRLPHRQQPPQIPTLQQHLQNKMDSCPDFPPMHDKPPQPLEKLPEDSALINAKMPSEKSLDMDLINDIIEGGENISVAVLEELGLKAKLQKSLPNIDPALIDANMPSEHSLDTDLINDIIDGGESVSVAVLEEMGLKSKLQKSLPAWVGDVLDASEQDIDPEVLKELLHDSKSSKGSKEEKLKPSSDAKGEAVERKQSYEATLYEKLKLDAMREAQKDFVAKKHYEGKKTVHLQLPEEDDEELQPLADENMRPSCDFEELEAGKFEELLSGGKCKEPISDTDAGVQSEKDIPSSEEYVRKKSTNTQPTAEESNAFPPPSDGMKKRPSAVAHDTRGPIPPANGIFGSYTSATELEKTSADANVNVPARALKTEEELQHGTTAEKEPIVEKEPERVSNVDEDTRGPIPDADLVFCASPSQPCRTAKCVGIAIYDVNTNADTGSDDMSEKEGSPGGLIHHGMIEDTSRPSYSSYSDRKPPPPIEVSPQSTLQSSQNQSSSNIVRSRSTVDYPSDEETRKPPPDSLLPSPVPRMSSSGEDTPKDTPPLPFTLELPPQDLNQPPPPPDEVSPQHLPSQNMPSPHEEPPQDLLHRPPPLRRTSSSSSFSSFDDGPPHDAHTKPSLGFLSPSYAHHFDMDDVHAAAMKMRQVVLEEMRTNEILAIRKRRRFQPIDI